jgi:hypothetical protein
VWAYVGFGATVPSLYDRSIWTVVSLSVIAMMELERRRTEQEPPPATAPEPAVRVLPTATRSGATS